jgi:hypothetical protein
MVASSLIFCEDESISPPFRIRMASQDCSTVGGGLLEFLIKLPNPMMLE